MQTVKISANLFLALEEGIWLVCNSIVISSMSCNGMYLEQVAALLISVLYTIMNQVIFSSFFYSVLYL